MAAPPFLVRDLLRQLWGLPDAALAPPAVTATVHQRLREAGIASEAEALLLLQLLDVPMDLAPLAALSPEMRKARTLRCCGTCSGTPVSSSPSCSRWRTCTGATRPPRSG